MNPHERDETWEPPRDMRSHALRLIATQAITAAGLAVFLLFLPVSPGWGLWVPAVAVLLGSWTWSRREGRTRPELLTLEGVRALARAVVFPLGLLTAVAYLALAVLLPDQLDLPVGVFLLVTALMGLAGGISGAILTLCGLDLGRPVSTRRPRG